MLLVLALMAVVAAAASLSLAQLRLNSDMAATIDRLKYFDDLTRHQAEQFGRPLILTFDAATVRRLTPTQSPDDPAPPSMQLPDGFTIEQVKIAADDQTGVPISADGLSPTYALLLTRGRQRQWLIVSAVGQSRAVADDGTLEYEMDQLRQP
jgi:type II secretory pathway pseudopilin PulG